MGNGQGRDSAHGILRAEDVKYIAQALTRPVVLIENSRNTIAQQKEILGNLGGKKRSVLLLLKP
jgi:hypothetical protein